MNITLIMQNQSTIKRTDKKRVRIIYELLDEVQLTKIIDDPSDN